MKNAVLFTFALSMFWSLNSNANIIKVNSLGSSPKGQYVAFEEFGVTEDNTAFVKIRFFNTWKNKYVSKSIEIDNSNNKESLDSIRSKAKKLASPSLKSFNIRG